MAEKRYIHIRNWDRFQHYKKRGAPWIKDYVEQLHDDDTMSLTLAQVGLLQRLRILYAASGERGISEDRARTRLTTSAADARRVREHLDALNHAGLIVFSASKTLAPCNDDARPEVETEREVEKDQEQDPSVQPVARPPENGRTDEQVFDYQNILKEMPA